MKVFPIVSKAKFSNIKKIDLSVNALGPFDSQEDMEQSLRILLDDYKRGAGDDVLLYGGYRERRGLYQASQHFLAGKIRNIHLGIDIWVSPGEEIFAFQDGTVHSWKYNTGHLDYGYCLIVRYADYSVLYGHLDSPGELDWTPGRQVKAGEIIARVGDKDVNGGWVPHLHLQIIKDTGEYFGDYPGVCNEDDLSFYSANCPDPYYLLGF